MAMIFNKTTQKNRDNAAAKAKQLKPRVKVLSFGRFEVEGTGDRYTTEMGKNSQGEFEVTCTNARTGQPCPTNKKGQACYHRAAVSGIFKL